MQCNFHSCIILTMTLKQNLCKTVSTKTEHQYLHEVRNYFRTIVSDLFNVYSIYLHLRVLALLYLSQS